MRHEWTINFSDNIVELFQINSRQKMRHLFQSPVPYGLHVLYRLPISRGINMVEIPSPEPIRGIFSYVMAGTYFMVMPHK